MATIPLQDYIAEIVKKKEEATQLMLANKHQNALALLTDLKANIEKYIKDITPKPIPPEVGKTYKQTLSNLAVWSLKLENYTDSISYDKLLLQIDENNDQCYARLFSSNLAINKREEAVLFGSLLKYRFNKKTLDKYRDILPLIELESEKYKRESSSLNIMPSNKNKEVLIVKLTIVFFAICYIVWCIVNRKELDRFNKNKSPKH